MYISDPEELLLLFSQIICQTQDPILLGEFQAHFISNCIKLKEGSDISKSVSIANSKENVPTTDEMLQHLLQGNTNKQGPKNINDSAKNVAEESADKQNLKNNVGFNPK